MPCPLLFAIAHPSALRHPQPPKLPREGGRGGGGRQVSALKAVEDRLGAHYACTHIRCTFLRHCLRRAHGDAGVIKGEGGWARALHVLFGDVACGPRRLPQRQHMGRCHAGGQRHNAPAGRAPGTAAPGPVSPRSLTPVTRLRCNRRRLGCNRRRLGCNRRRLVCAPWCGLGARPKVVASQPGQSAGTGPSARLPLR